MIIKRVIQFDLHLLTTVLQTKLLMTALQFEQVLRIQGPRGDL